MTTTIATTERHSEAASKGLAISTLAAILLSLFAADNILLLHFMGLPLAVTLLTIGGAVPLIMRICRALPVQDLHVPYRALVVGFVIAFLMFMLGGQGGFFYANPDWQIRDAVLRDMATHSWPYAYSVQGVAYFLRAPLGTYLFPALFGPAAGTVLLLSNALRLALLIGLAWPLFNSNRTRVISLIVFVLFSGWDALGTAFYSAMGQQVSWDHIERWNLGFQYSSHLTQAFWVPQHAIAGWACAVTFLLWRKGLVPIGLFAASIPLVTLWSPLAIIGAVPFALIAGVEALQTGKWGKHDVAAAAAGLLIATPALLYLQVDAAKVGYHIRDINPWVLIFCALFEVLPFILPLLVFDRQRPSAERSTLLLIFLLLLVMPLVQIGEGFDFQMRASIVPLALLAIAFAEWLARPPEGSSRNSPAIAYGILAIGIGAITPSLEFKRAVVNGPSPPPLCSLIGVWYQQDNTIVPFTTYLAPVPALPHALRAIPVTAGGSDPIRCWARPWVVPQ